MKFLEPPEFGHGLLVYVTVTVDNDIGFADKVDVKNNATDSFLQKAAKNKMVNTASFNMFFGCGIFRELWVVKCYVMLL